MFSPLLLDPKKDPEAKEWCFQKQLNGSQLPSPRRKELALEMNTQAFHILMEGQGTNQSPPITTSSASQRRQLRPQRCQSDG